jgi:putative tricarboxylic transport membrane protein
MIGRDGIAAAVCFAVSIVMLVMTKEMPHSPLVPIGPDFYPRIVLTVGALLSAILLVSDLVANAKRRNATAVPAEPAAAPKNYKLVILTFVLFTFYVAALAPLGYRISTFLFVIAQQVLLEPPRAVKRWIFVIVVAALTSWVTYVVFEGYLQVLLPRGTWTGW